MVRTVKLHEGKHAVALLRGLKQMKHEKKHCDFVISVPGHEYRAHKSVLCVASRYFKAMLESDMRESLHGKVEMVDVDFECVKSCIDFMYTGNFDIPDGKMMDLLHVANLMQLGDVTKAISHIFVEELSLENFYDTRSAAEMYNLQPLSLKCREYYENNLMEISSQVRFSSETKSLLLDIFRSKTLRLVDEEKFTVALRWVDKNPDKRDDLLDFIKLINLKKVSPLWLSDLIENHPVISNDLRLYRLLNAPLVGYVNRTCDYDKYFDLMVFFSYEDYVYSYDIRSFGDTKRHHLALKHLGKFLTVAMGSCIYALCSDKSVHRLDFRESKLKWAKMCNMVYDHGERPPAAALSGCLYVVGSSDLQSTDVEMFKPDVNRWVKLGQKSSENYDETPVALNDSIYCVGGVDDEDVPVNSLCRFTPSNSEWVDLEPMKVARFRCGVAAVEQRIFVIGGMGEEEGPLKEVECYEVNTGQWTLLAPMLLHDYHIIANFFDRSIYVALKSCASLYIQRYDIENNTWEQPTIRNTMGPDGHFFIRDFVMVKF